MPFDLARIAQEAGILLGTVIAFFVIIERTAKAYQIISERIHSRNLKSRLKAILLEPTLEELAKYSIKQPQRFEPGEGLYRKPEQESSEEIRQKRLQGRAEFRILILITSFIFAFTIMAVRMTFLALW